MKAREQGLDTESDSRIFLPTRKIDYLCDAMTERTFNNMKNIIYKTRGTCSQFIEIEGDNGFIKNVKFYGGCDGNLQGIARLVTGMKYEEVIERLNGISCNGKPTSCPDQLCRAIEQLMKEEE